MLKQAKTNHRKLVRKMNNAVDEKNDPAVFSILSSSSSSGSIYKRIKSLKTSSAEKIPFLKIGDKVYNGEDVKDGFYDSISKLKSRDNLVQASSTIINYAEDYSNILDLCKNKSNLPKISLAKSTEILKSMKHSVIDIFSVTPAHFIHAGDEGLKHFNYLLNSIIENVNNATVEELNACYALLLYKGHGKVKTSDSAYRTISTFPVVSKALDLYIRDLNIGKWNLQQAPTQYQGEGSSHELAALLVTEIVQHSLYYLKESIYMPFFRCRVCF